MKLIFATNNEHKVKEIKVAVPPHLTIITLKEAGINIDIPEPFATLQENAVEKARTIYTLTKTDCFSEDTGLEAVALNGEPGVYSARYAGEKSSSPENIGKLLRKLEGIKDRKAQFRTVVCLIVANTEYIFEGICEGVLTKEPLGVGGFGYDPVFIPFGSDHTFAQMNLTEKNRYSHRRKAIDKLVVFLNSIA